MFIRLETKRKSKQDLRSPASLTDSNQLFVKIIQVYQYSLFTIALVISSPTLLDIKRKSFLDTSGSIRHSVKQHRKMQPYSTLKMSHEKMLTSAFSLKPVYSGYRTFQQCLYIQNC